MYSVLDSFLVAGFWKSGAIIMMLIQFM